MWHLACAPGVPDTWRVLLLLGVALRCYVPIATDDETAAWKD